MIGVKVVVCNWLFVVTALFGICLLCYLAVDFELVLLVLIVLMWFLGSLLLLLINDLGLFVLVFIVVALVYCC